MAKPPENVTDVDRMALLGREARSASGVDKGDEMGRRSQL